MPPDTKASTGMPPTRTCGFVTTGPPDIEGEGVVGREDESEQAATYIGRSVRADILITLRMFIVVEPRPER